MTENDRKLKFQIEKRDLSSRERENPHSTIPFSSQTGLENGGSFERAGLGDWSLGIGVAKAPFC